MNHFTKVEPLELETRIEAFDRDLALEKFEKSKITIEGDFDSHKVKCTVKFDMSLVEWPFSDCDDAFQAFADGIAFSRVYSDQERVRELFEQLDLRELALLGMADEAIAIKQGTLTESWKSRETEVYNEPHPDKKFEEDIVRITEKRDAGEDQKITVLHLETPNEEEVEVLWHHDPRTDGHWV